MLQLQTQELLFPEHQNWFNNCHASTLVRAGNGDLLCAFFGGEREGAPDMAIWMSRLSNKSWQPPVRIRHTYRLPHWNPVLHRDGNRIWLYYKVGPTVPEWYTLASYSDDDGFTWSCPEEAVPNDYTTRVAVRNKLLIASNGDWLGPCSVEGEKYWDSFVDISRDKGKTWTISPIPLNHETAPQQSGGGEWNGLAEGALWECDLSTVLQWDGIIQPSLWESQPGHIHAFMRSPWREICRSDSIDYGAHWCEAYPTGLPNNNSGIDIAKMDDNTLALVCNPVSGNWTMRSPLSVLFSHDNGLTFPERIDLETAEGEFSYPAIVAEKESLLITYTYKRKSIVFCTLK